MQETPENIENGCEWTTARAARAGF
jgi:hypothetical protein